MLWFITYTWNFEGANMSLADRIRALPCDSERTPVEHRTQYAKDCIEQHARTVAAAVVVAEQYDAEIAANLDKLEAKAEGILALMRSRVDEVAELKARLGEVEQQITETGRAKHGASGLCCGLREIEYRERRRAEAERDDLQASVEVWKSENTRHMREAESMASLAGEYRRQRDALLALYREEREEHLPLLPSEDSEYEAHRQTQYRKETEVKIGQALWSPTQQSSPVPVADAAN